MTAVEIAKTKLGKQSDVAFDAHMAMKRHLRHVFPYDAPFFSTEEYPPISGLFEVFPGDLFTRLSGAGLTKLWQNSCRAVHTAQWLNELNESDVLSRQIVDGMEARVREFFKLNEDLLVGYVAVKELVDSQPGRDDTYLSCRLVSMG